MRKNKKQIHRSDQGITKSYEEFSYCDAYSLVSKSERIFDKHMFVKSGGWLYNETMRTYQSDINRILSLIYDDQPIAPSQRAPLPMIPERIRAVRSLAKGVASWRQPREVIFVHQAQLMADYEDDFEYPARRSIPVWHPTYESLTDEQLRGYFGWRTRLRKGESGSADSCFVYLYVYELLNLIGCSGPEEAFARLCEFADLQEGADSEIRPWIEKWLIDFVLYYEMDPALLLNRKPLVYDRALAVLLREEEHSRELFEIQKKQKENRKGKGLGAGAGLKISSGGESLKNTQDSEAEGTVFQALLTVSGMRENQLAGFAKDPELFRNTTTRSFQKICIHYFSNRKKTFMEDCTGGEKNEPTQLFCGAVFHDRSPVKGSGTFSGRRRCFDVTLSPVTTFHCEMGKWAVRTYRRDYHHPRFCELLKTVDSVLRTENGEAGVEDCGLQMKWIRKLISESAAEWKKEKEEEEACRIEIDLRILEGIRSSSELTMEKLMTDEERDLSGETDFGNETAEDQRSEKSLDVIGILEEEKERENRGASVGLSETETEILRWILHPDRCRKPDTGTQILSVIVDRINEILYDTFFDTVIENETVPSVIEDYRNDLEELVF